MVLPSSKACKETCITTHQRNKIDLLMTNPEKKALIHPIIKLCGIIIAIFPFIIPIIPSIAAGSLIGFGLGLPRDSGSARNFPSW
jgi:hypothetical protein